MTITVTFGGCVQVGVEFGGLRDDTIEVQGKISGHELDLVILVLIFGGIIFPEGYYL